MRKAAVVCCWVILCVLFASAPARAGADFVINIFPASLLINVDDTFAVMEDDGTRLSVSAMYFMPNISAGIGFDLGCFFVDLTAGAGLVYNESFRSFLAQAQVATMYAVTDSLKIGPHAGIISFPNPEWIERTELVMDGSRGWIAGMEMTMGDRIMYVASADYVSTTFDMLTGPGLSSESDELKMSAVVVQIGVRGEF